MTSLLRSFRTREATDGSPGWDLTFSAPKSVSVLWANADSRTRQKIQQAHFGAVENSIKFLESEAAVSRKGKEGKALEQVGLTVATFEHATSRAHDPQLHTHALVLNVGVAANGRTRTLHSKPLYQHKMLAGAVYRCSLSHRLERDLGLVCKRHQELEEQLVSPTRQDRSGFEVAGVPRVLMDHHSTRRKDIETKLDELGLDTASASAYAALETRPVKDLVPPRDELFKQWQRDAQDYGFSRESVDALLGQSPERKTSRQLNAALSDSLESLTASENYFTRQQLLRRTLETAQGRGLDPFDVIQHVDRKLLSDREMALLGRDDNGQAVYSTNTVYRQERRLIDLGRKLGKKSEKVHNVRWLNARVHMNHREVRIIDGRPRLISLSSDQRAAVKHITRDTRQLAVVTGIAGTGKTFMLKVARKIWQAQGYQVIGCAFAGKAAKELQKGSGIKSETLQSLLLKANPSLKYRLTYHAKGLLRTALRKTPFGGKAGSPRPYLNKKTIVVLDEASMVSNHQFLQLLQEIDRAGAKLVCLGDSSQLSAIGRGGAFRGLAKIVGHVVLDTIVRQKDIWARLAVRDARDNNIADCLKAFQQHDCLHQSEDREQTIQHLIERWSEDNVKKPKDALILVTTRADARDLNERCQRERLKVTHKDVAPEAAKHAMTHDGQRIYRGDRILFTSDDPHRKHTAKTGELATVTSVSPRLNSITVRVDGDRKTKRISLRRARDVTLGYAVTTHSAQGTTVKNAYVLLGGAMQDAEMFYTQISRARNRTQLFVDEPSTGVDFEDLVASLSISNEKMLAREVANSLTPEARHAERDRQFKRDLDRTVTLEPTR